MGSVREIMGELYIYILVGGLEHFLFFPIVRMMIQSDFHIFQRGRYTTNQYISYVDNQIINLPFGDGLH